jgi:hypothetical protein
MQDHKKFMQIVSQVEKIGNKLGANPTPKAADKAIAKLMKKKTELKRLKSTPLTAVFAENLDIYIAALKQAKEGNHSATEKLLKAARRNWAEFLRRCK